MMDNQALVTIFGPEVAPRLPRVREALLRRGTFGLGEVTGSFPALRITLPAAREGVAAISISAAPDVSGDLYAETALIGPDGCFVHVLGYEDTIQRFWSEDDFFDELELLGDLLAN